MIAKQNDASRQIRCAIYTRKSSEEGLGSDFTSLDSQREYAESYIASQRANGFVALPERYDDGGYSGGSAERPGLKRLMADIDAGAIDAVIVYKVDRLSRSLLDFARMMAVFEDRKVAFVSVTQHFDTTQSMGRLTLNILLSFAQFERELVSERTRDKIAASRKRGKWWGSRAPLGYRFDAAAGKLVVVEEEAALVRKVFATYLETESLERTASLLDAQGHRTKAWTFKNGDVRGGLRWDKPHVRLVITNKTCRGLVPHHDEAFPGTHEPIVDEDTWTRANELLARNARNGADAAVPIRHGLLNGLLRCAACDAAMSHQCTVRKGVKAYRYYVCGNASRRGRDACPAPSVPAEEIERFVVDRLRGMAGDRAIVDAVFAELERRSSDRARNVAAREQAARRERMRLTREIERAALVSGNEQATARVIDLERQIAEADEVLSAARREAEALASETASRAETARLLGQFDPVWSRLTAGERGRVLRALVERVDYHGVEGKLTVSFADTGIETLAAGKA